MVFEILETMTSEEPSPSATEHMVRTRDGVLLATDVYLPGGGEAHSAILVRTPYDKSSRYTALRHEAEYFCHRGYAYVAQDVRGKFRSTGATVPYAFDVDDAYDTVQWITEQSWSNQKVGIVGASYYGYTTWAAVASDHPAIKAAVPQVTGIEMANGHVGGRYINEVPSLLSLNDALQIWTDNKGYLAEIEWGADSVPNIIDAWQNEVGECIGGAEKMQRAKTQEWYNPYGVRHPHHTTTIPILHWQNWYDPGLAPLGLADWRHFRSLGGVRDLHYLRVGSADHGGFLLEDVEEGDAKNPYLNDAALNRRIEEWCGEMADFFDEFVNGVQPETPRPRARWHVGHVGWRESAEYPPPSTPLVFHLSASGDQVQALELDADSEQTRLSWTHDPDNPVPSTSHIEAIWYLLAAYPDERSLADRVDVLTFRTKPLTSDIDFAGQPELVASIAFSSPSTHVYVRLQDVYADGTTRPISWGRTVLTDAAGGELRMRMDDNAYRLRRGHLLQLQIMSSDFPHFLVHPGTDENPWFATSTAKAAHSIKIGGVDGATLILPTI